MVHSVEQLPCVLQAAAFSVSIKEAVLDEGLRGERGLEEAAVDASGVSEGIGVDAVLEEKGERD